MCLAFDVPDEWITEVTYSASRLPCELEAALTSPGEGQRLIELLFSTKFRGWAYEDEVRLLIMLKEEQKVGKDYLAEFDADLKLREVIFGPRCALADQTALHRALSTYCDEISVLKARLAFRSFKVVRDLRGLTEGSLVPGH